MLALFIALKLWKRVSGDGAAGEQRSGLDIATTLESLSMLSLDRAPPEPTDEERRADQSPIQAVGNWVQQRFRPKQPVVTEESIVRMATHELRDAQHGVPGVDIVRQ